MSAFHERARAAFALRHYDAAASACVEALREDPNDAEAHALFAVVLLSMKRVGDATREADAGIAANPALPFAHYVNGWVQRERGLLDDARRSAKEALRLGGVGADLFALLAQIEINAGNATAAYSAARRGLRESPSHPGCTRLQVLALADLNRQPQALSVGNDLLAENPMDP